MKTFDQNGNEILITKVSGYGVDAYIETASYTNSDTEPSDETLDYLTERYPEIVEAMAFDNEISAAESYADFLQDR